MMPEDFSPYSAGPVAAPTTTRTNDHEFGSAREVPPYGMAPHHLKKFLNTLVMHNPNAFFNQNYNPQVDMNSPFSLFALQQQQHQKQMQQQQQQQHQQSMNIPSYRMPQLPMQQADDGQRIPGVNEPIINGAHFSLELPKFSPASVTPHDIVKVENTASEQQPEEKQEVATRELFPANNNMNEDVNSANFESGLPESASSLLNVDHDDSIPNGSTSQGTSQTVNIETRLMTIEEDESLRPEKNISVKSEQEMVEEGNFESAEDDANIDGSPDEFMGEPGPSTSSDERVWIKCKLCNFNTVEIYKYEKHIEMEHKHTCFRCYFTAEDEMKLHEHRINCTSNGYMYDASSPKVKQKSKPKKAKECKKCQYKTFDEILYYDHLIKCYESEPGKLLRCNVPDCKFVTPYKHHFDYHEKNHSGVKPFECNKCNYRCVNKSMLNSHMKSHSNFYSYRCKDCRYEAKYCHALKQHCRKYGHVPHPVLNPDGGINPFQIIDVYGTRRGPKIKRDAEGNPVFPSSYTAKFSVQPDMNIPRTPTSNIESAINVSQNDTFQTNSLFSSPTTHSTPAFPGLPAFNAPSTFFNTPPPVPAVPHLSHLLNSPLTPLSANTRNMYSLFNSMNSSPPRKPVTSEIKINNHSCTECGLTFGTKEILDAHTLIAHSSGRTMLNSQSETPRRSSIDRNSSEHMNTILALLAYRNNHAESFNSLNESLPRLPWGLESTPNHPTSTPVHPVATSSSGSPLPLDLTKDHTPPQQILRRSLSTSPPEASASNLTPPDTCSPPKKQRRSDFQISATRRLEVKSDMVEESTSFTEVKPEVKTECQWCKITFGSESMFTTHMKFHDLKNPKRCAFCQQNCESSTEFFDHIMFCNMKRNL